MVWCYLAKARVDHALALNSEAKQFPRWLPYQLTPYLAPQGVDHPAFFANRVGTEEAKRYLCHDGTKAAEEGLKLDYSHINIAQYAQGTCPGQLAGDRQMAAHLVGQLLSAHFSEGRDIGHDETLLEIGGRSWFEIRRHAPCILKQ
jgi:predicted DsbA family dithiol-disulfide isomerase